jgi:hypothetical protein
MANRNRVKRQPMIYLTTQKTKDRAIQTLLKTGGQFQVLRKGYYLPFFDLCNAGFTYRLNMLKPRASQFRGPPAKV